MLARTSLALFEADTRSRGLRRQALSSDDPHSHIRHALSRLRGGEDPHKVGLDLHRASPEGHAQFVADKSSPHRTVVAAAPHYHAHDTHDQAYDEHVSNPPKVAYDPHTPAWKKHNRTGGELLHKKHEAWTALRKIARGHNVDIQHLVRPREGEPMHKHMRRIMITVVQKEANSQNRGFSLKSRPDHHVGVFDFVMPARRLAATANHHWGHSHETTVAANPHSQFKEWKVSTTKRKES